MSEGIVISREGQKLEVYIKDKNSKLRAIPRGKVIKKYSKIYVGDIVMGNILNSDFIIEDIKERKNVILRPPIANVNRVILLFTIKDPEISFIQLDKLLCAYEFLGLDIIIVFNKLDVIENEEFLKIKEIYEGARYEVLGISVKENYNLNLLKEKINGGINILAGPSGVGKSSLVKVLTGENLRIGELSLKTKRGTQTTVEIKIFIIDENTFVADTPGFSKIDLKLLMKKEKVRLYFREFRKFKCAFSDCLHINEEGCSIKEAVKNGEISNLRYSNYLKILESDF